MEGLESRRIDLDSNGPTDSGTLVRRSNVLEDGCMRMAIHKTTATISLLVLLAVLHAGFASRADAYPPQFQFNVLGWTNGSWGNEGHLMSVNYLTSTISVYTAYGFDTPNSIATEEMYWDWRSSYSNSSQFVQLYSYAVFVNAGNVLYDWATEDTHSSGYAYCQFGGESVIARANSGTARWRATDRLLLPTVGPHDRQLLCSYPRLGFTTPATCVAHLDTDLAWAQLQLTAITNSLGSATYTGHPIVFSGDLNLTYAQGSSAACAFFAGQEADPTFTDTYSAESPFKKIDDIFYRGYIWQANGGVLTPGYCTPGGVNVVCGPLGGHRVSDHKLLSGLYW